MKKVKQAQEVVEIVAVIDRSGSMGGLENDVIGGFNSFLEAQQKATYKAKLTLSLFDHEHFNVHDGMDVREVKALDTSTYTVRGSTALYDAIGRTINQVAARNPVVMKACESCGHEEPVKQKVIVMVITDGFENASKEYTQGRIKGLIEAKKELGWEFIFTMAGVDQATAESFTCGMSINSGHTHTVTNTARGQSAAYGTMTNAVSFYANGEDLNSGNYRIQDSP